MELDLMVNSMPVHAVYDEQDINEIFLPLLKEIDRRQKEKNGRIFVMLAAPPAAGKSSLSKTLAKLAAGIPGMEPVTVIGMDGYHRYMSYLTTHTMMRDGKELVMVEIKGCPESFDLPRLTENIREVATGCSCTWPDYDRMKKDPIEGALKVDSNIVLLEGNYLLLDREGWKDLAQYADLTIRITAEPEFLRKRLIGRKYNTGVTMEEAVHFVDFSDMVNVKTCLEHTREADINLYLDTEGRYHRL